VRTLFAIALAVASGGVARAQCPSAEALCGTGHCAPVGNVCCASVGHEEVSCQPSFQCTTDGKCQSTCPAGQASTIASCGADTCSCSVRCTHHKDCESSCCTTAGYCAPLCVCNGFGKLFVDCDPNGVGAGPIPVHGCQAAPGDAAGALLLVALALAALRLRRASG
jgi:MYXO-CTERM domain-containing protein